MYDYYQSKGKGTFAINPLSGLSGVYIGEENLAQILSDLNSKIPTNYVTTDTEQTITGKKLINNISATNLTANTATIGSLNAYSQSKIVINTDLDLKSSNGADGYKIMGVKTPTENWQAANKYYVDTNFVSKTELINSIEQTILPISGTANRASPVYGGTIDFSKLTYNYPIKSISSMIVKSATTSGSFASSEVYLKVFQSNTDPITNSVSDYTFLGASENKQSNTINTVMTFSFNNLIVDETKSLLVMFSTTNTNDFNNLVGCRIELVNENPNTFPNIGYITSVSNGNLTIAQAQSLDLTIVATADAYEIGDQCFYNSDGINKKFDSVESQIPTNHVTTDTAQTITGTKTLVGPTKFNLDNGSANGISIKANQLPNGTDVFKEYYQPESGNDVRRSMIIEAPSGNGTDLVLKQGNNDRRLVLSVPHGPHSNNNGIYLTTSGAGIYLDAGTGSINVLSDIDLKSSDGTNGKTIMGVNNPVRDYQVANKKYVDEKTAPLMGITPIAKELLNEVQLVNITDVSTTMDTFISGIAYNGSKYIASTRGDGLLSSSDGINWTQSKLLIKNESGEVFDHKISILNKIRYLNGYFFASVANLRYINPNNSSEAIAHPYHGIIYSSDGINWDWTPAKYLVEDYPANESGSRWRRFIYDIIFDGTNYVFGTDRWDWQTGVYVGELSWFSSVTDDLHTLNLGDNYGAFSVSYSDLNNNYVIGTRTGVLTVDTLEVDAVPSVDDTFVGKAIYQVSYYKGQYVAAEYGTDPGGIWISIDGLNWELKTPFEEGRYIQQWTLRPIYLASGIWAFLSMNHSGVDGATYSVYVTNDFNTYVETEIRTNENTLIDIQLINGRLYATGSSKIYYVDISNGLASLDDISNEISKYNISTKAIESIVDEKLGDLTDTYVTLDTDQTISGAKVFENGAYGKAIVTEVNPDVGKVWSQSNITSGYFDSVFYGDNLWVAGGTGLYYSEDGMNWTQSNITSGYFRSVRYSDGLWVAGNKGLYYSEDGMTWTQSNITSDSIYSVHYANGLWVAGTGSNGIYYSTDGKTWTNFNSSFGKVTHINYANNLWLASSETSGILFSLNGMSWSRSNLTGSNSYSTCYANNLWTAASSLGIYYSEDGIGWTPSNLINIGVFSLHYSNGLWVAGSNNGLYYSIDGKTWIQSNITTGAVKSILYSNGLWIAISNGSLGIYYSEDGMNWIQSNITSDSFYSLHYANGLWVTTSDSNKGLYYSKYILGDSEVQSPYVTSHDLTKIIEQLQAKITSLEAQLAAVTTETNNIATEMEEI